MYQAKTIYAEIALKAILYFLETGKYLEIEIHDELKRKAACFVTLRSADGSLRGCIGTLSPVRKNLQEEIIRNAVSSAIHDSRFEPLTAKEAEEISLSTEVLNEPEIVESGEFLDPKKYGLIIEDRNGHRGVLLPDIEGIETVDEQIRIVKRKAGISGNENLEFRRFTSTKFR
jgi:hypothetical protein